MSNASRSSTVTACAGRNAPSAAGATKKPKPKPTLACTAMPMTTVATSTTSRTIAASYWPGRLARHHPADRAHQLVHLLARLGGSLALAEQAVTGVPVEQ